MHRLKIARFLAVAALTAGGLALPAATVASARTRTHHHSNRTRKFSFYAKVVRSSPKGVLLKHSGHKLWFSAKQLGRQSLYVHKSGHKRHTGRRIIAHMALVHSGFDGTSPGPVTVDIVGLQPGVTVLVTETVDSSGNVTITITLPSPGSLSEQTADGVVTEVDSQGFMLQTPGGSDLRLLMAPSALSALGLQLCDQATVTYHQDSDLLIADTVQVTGTSPSQACQSSGDSVGTITSVSESGLTISTSQGSMTFGVQDDDITDGYQVGDVVDVTWSKNADGSLDASNVQYVEQQASGVVTSVSWDSMTITDSSTGQPDTFVAGNNGDGEGDYGAFGGVSNGDQVDVTYHVSNGQMVADQVVDNSGGWGGGDGNGGGY